jgi:hypothetical protein
MIRSIWLLEDVQGYHQALASVSLECEGIIRTLFSIWSFVWFTYPTFDYTHTLHFTILEMQVVCKARKKWLKEWMHGIQWSGIFCIRYLDLQQVPTKLAMFLRRSPTINVRPCFLRGSPTINVLFDSCIGSTNLGPFYSSHLSVSSCLACVVYYWCTRCCWDDLLLCTASR